MPTPNQTRLTLRLPAELKATIEEAATLLGQSAEDFAVSTLVHHARQVIAEHRVTRLSNRDRDLFIRLLDDPTAEPNAALLAAAARYRHATR